MSAIIRNGYPVIHSAIVNVEAGLPGGAFVTLDPATNMVTENASTWDGNTYLTVNVVREPNSVGDDATAVVPKGGYIAMVHLNPGDEAIVTGLEGDIGATVRGAFVIVDKLIYNGKDAAAIRCIEQVEETEETA